jgi:hypothetical protein
MRLVNDLIRCRGYGKCSPTAPEIVRQGSGEPTQIPGCPLTHHRAARFPSDSIAAVPLRK